MKDIHDYIDMADINMSVPGRLSTLESFNYLMRCNSALDTYVDGYPEYFVERHVFNEGSDDFKILKTMLLIAAKLRNTAVFYTRQHFFHKTDRNYSFDMFEDVSGKYISYKKLYDYLYYMTDPNLDILPANVAQGVLRDVINEWSSYKKLMSDKKKGLYDKPVSIPNYIDTKNGGTYALNFYLATLSKKNLERGIVNIPTTDISFRTMIPAEKIHEIKLSYSTGQIIADVVYGAPERTPVKQDNGSYLAIDPGLDNYYVIVSNVSTFRPVIIDGREIKSENRYYNRKISLYTKKKAEDNPYFDADEYVRRLWRKRKNQFDDYMHLISERVVEMAVTNNINTIIIGHNDRWKDKLPFRKDVKQNFAYIPFKKTIDLIKYKAAYFGIRVVLQEESYTSKASFLDDDFIPTYVEGNKTKYKFSGERIKRGLYRTSSGVLLNADVNGAYNIMRKYLKVSSKDILSVESMGLVMAPVRVRLNELKHQPRKILKVFNKN